MAKEKVTVSIAGIKANLLSGDAETVKRMASALDASVNRKLKYVGDHPDVALLVVAMEQSESLRKNADLIHNQQEQIFALTTRISAMTESAEEIPPIESTENAIMAENKRLLRRIDELCDELEQLKKTRRS